MTYPRSCQQPSQNRGVGGYCASSLCFESWGLSQFLMREGQSSHQLGCHRWVVRLASNLGHIWQAQLNLSWNLVFIYKPAGLLAGSQYALDKANEIAQVCQQSKAA